jgi:predicted membrane protein
MTIIGLILYTLLCLLIAGMIILIVYKLEVHAHQNKPKKQRNRDYESDEKIE